MMKKILKVFKFYSYIHIKNVLILFIFLSPFIYTIYRYKKLSFYDDYFINLLSPIENHWKLVLWILALTIAINWHSFCSFMSNLGALFIKQPTLQNISDGNDGYISGDDFGKKTFAQNILQIIDNFHKDENRTKSLVIGLDGKWGSGKTFVIKKIKEILHENKYPDFQLFSFQPWLFAKNTNYTNVFIDKLNSELVKLNCGISMLYLSAFKDMLDNSCGILGKIISLFINKSDEELKEIIQKKINQTQKKFLIIIDDLDRLDPEEILQIFKLIRCVANFENLYFILCLDRNIVENGINEYFKQNNQTGKTKANYCDKIINLYFEVPTITSEDLNTLLDKLIDQDNELKTWKEQHNFGDHFFSKLETHYPPLNVREVKIILNKLKAISLLKYQTLEPKYELLYQNTEFYIFKILEMIKIKDLQLYNNIKFSILWNTNLPDNIIPNDVKEIRVLINLLKQTKLKHFYFAYNSGDLPISYEQYKKILNNLSWDTLVEVQRKRHLSSFFIHAIYDNELSSEQFTKIVYIHEFQREESQEFDILFNKKVNLLNCKEYFQQDYSSLGSLHTYELINNSEDDDKRKEYIKTYVETYHTCEALLPENNLIFYIDFKKYTSELYGILFHKLFTRDIQEASGLLSLLNKFMEETNGDTSLWDINIIKKQCKLQPSQIIKKLENDYEKVQCDNIGYRTTSKDEDNQKSNILTAYQKIIEFIKTNEKYF